MFGILTESCIGVENYKNKDWRPLGKKALLLIHKNEKDVWDNTAGRFVKQPVHKDERYLFNRL